jgi:pimeloyl-ACP methyl ester carboxylesterase
MNYMLTITFVLIILLCLHLIGLFVSSFFIKKSSFININGYNIHFKRTGAGSKKIILIHGMFSNFHCWDKFLEFKNSDTEYISLDLPQMGESQSKHKKTPVDNIEDLIFKFAQELKLENPIIVGCSLGGLVAYLSVLKYPDYFSKCIIVASPFDSKVLLLPLYNFSFLAPILNLFVNPIIVFLAQRRISGTEFSIKRSLIIFSKFRHIQHFRSSLDYTKLIPRVESNLTIPTKVENYHFIWGTRDHLIKKANFKNFLGHNERLDYDEIPDGTHHPMESHPKEFSLVLDKILKSSN